MAKLYLTNENKFLNNKRKFTQEMQIIGTVELLESKQNHLVEIPTKTK